MSVNDIFGIREFLNNEEIIAGTITLPLYKKHVLALNYDSNDKLDKVYCQSVLQLPFANSNLVNPSILNWRSLMGPTCTDEKCKVVYELTFDVKEFNLNFKAGDTIGVVSENSDDEVDSILSHLGLMKQANFPYTLSVLNGQKGKIPAHIPVKSTLRHVLKYFVDIRCVLKKLFLLALSKYTEDERERKTLEYFCSTEGAQHYRQYFLGNEKNNALSLQSLFKVFKSCKPPVEVLLTHLPRFLPRPYSIVNSGLKNSNIMKICFSVLSSNKGLTTGWLENMILKDDLSNRFGKLRIEKEKDTSKVPIYLRSNTAKFSLPENKKNPFVFIAVGTAISPFIGFLEELEMYKSLKENDVTDDVWLFYGCRDPKVDHIYEKELNDFRERRVLKKLNVAFSAQNYGERHVQDLLENNSKELTDLMESNAHIFVCGDFYTFANTIKNALKMCLLNSGKTAFEAEKVISEMEKEKRFIVDSWA